MINMINRLEQQVQFMYFVFGLETPPDVYTWKWRLELISLPVVPRFAGIHWWETFLDLIVCDTVLGVFVQFFQSLVFCPCLHQLCILLCLIRHCMWCSLEAVAPSVAGCGIGYACIPSLQTPPHMSVAHHTFAS